MKSILLAAVLLLLYGTSQAVTITSLPPNNVPGKPPWLYLYPVGGGVENCTCDHPSESDPANSILSVEAHLWIRDLDRSGNLTPADLARCAPYNPKLDSDIHLEVPVILQHNPPPPHLDCIWFDQVFFEPSSLFSYRYAHSTDPPDYACDLGLLAVEMVCLFNYVSECSIYEGGTDPEAGKIEFAFYLPDITVTDCCPAQHVYNPATCGCEPLPLANDNPQGMCANPILGCDESIEVDLTGATVTPGFSSSCLDQPDVWFTFLGESPWPTQSLIVWVTNLDEVPTDVTVKAFTEAGALIDAKCATGIMPGKGKKLFLNAGSYVDDACTTAEPWELSIGASPGALLEVEISCP